MGPRRPRDPQRRTITHPVPVKIDRLGADHLIMEDRSSTRDGGRQRGATLVGYALTLAMMVAVAIASLTAMDRNSETFLENTGDKIGEPRLPRAEAQLLSP